MLKEGRINFFKVLCKPKMAVVYALLLPFAMQAFVGVYTSIIFDLFRWNSVRVLWVLLDILKPLLRFGAIILLANFALGKDRQPLRLLLQRGWLWILGAALVCYAVNYLPGWLSANESLTAFFEQRQSWVWIEGAVNMIETGAVVLLAARLLRRNEQEESGTPMWNRVSIALVLAVLILPMLMQAANIVVVERQSEQREQERAASNAFFEKYDLEKPYILGAPPPMSMFLGLPRPVLAAANSLQYLLLVGLCYTLAGGRISLAGKPRPSAEPLEMSDEVERGQQELGMLLKMFVALLLVQWVVTLLGENGTGLDTGLMLLCNGVFLYYGRRWARGIWFAYTAWSGLGALMGAVILYLRWEVLWRTQSLSVCGVLLGFLIFVLQVIITIRLLRKGDRVQSYMLYCMVSPPGSQQLRQEHRAKVLFWCVVAVDAAVLASYLLLGDLLR